MLNLNTILCIIKHIFYCIFHSVCCWLSFSPAVLALCSILQVFSSHNYSLISKHWFLLIYFADHAFSILYYSLLLDLSWPMFLFQALYFVLLLFFFFFPSLSHTDSFLSVISFPLCSVLSIYHYFLLTFCTFPTSVLTFSLLFAYIFQVLKGRIGFERNGGLFCHCVTIFKMVLEE